MIDEQKRLSASRNNITGRKTMKNRYIDLHTHTTRSDGRCMPGQLVEMAVKNNISVLAITDHNVLSPDVRSLENRHPGEVKLLTGSEISCRHTFTR